jgi:uncharacterized protein
MFFAFAIPAYVIFGTYVYLSVRKLFASTAGKVLFSIVFAILIAAFPVTETLTHTNYPAWMRSLLILGYMSLPILLYLFLLVLLFDLGKLLCRILNIASPDYFRTSSMRIAELCLLICIPVIITAVGWAKNANIEINRYHIQIAQKSSPLRHLRIAVAADFHLKDLTDRDFMEHFVEKINSLDADILLMPGDILEGDRQGEELGEFERQFHRVKTRYGLFASMGNHDSHGWRERIDFFPNSGITLLRDSVAVAGNAFTLIGRNDSHNDRRKSIAELMRAVSDSLPVIVLDHRPTDLDNIGATHADISVSGHTHGGQLFPLNYITDIVYKVSRGYGKIGNTHVFVTSGIQQWGPAVRTVGDSEIMVIDVDFK